VHPEVAREYARALVEMFRAYPSARLDSVGFRDLAPGVFSRTHWSLDNGIPRADSIEFNASMATDPAAVRRETGHDAGTGWFPDVARDRPAYARAVHEFGHVLDGSGGHRARRELTGHLMRHFFDRHPAATGVEDYFAWLRESLSGYSFHPGTPHPNPAEALAEAFLATEMRRAGGAEPDPAPRDRGDDPVQLIRDLLVGYADADSGVAAPRIGPLHDGPEYIGSDDTRSPDSGDRHRDAVDDEWSAMGLDEIVATLRDRYPFREITGFADRPGVPPLDLTLVREVARAVDLMMSRFPMLDVHNLRIGPVTDPGHVRGLAGYDLDPRDADRMVTDTITLNERLLRNPGEFYASRRRSEQTLHSPRNSAVRPAFATTVHELGHGLDYAGSTRARGTVEDLLVEYYSEKTGGFHPDEFSVWINQLSGYSFTNRGDLNRPEVLADAVLDVVLNGPEATEPARIVYAALLRESIDNYYDTFENEAAALRITDLGLGPWTDGYDRSAADRPDRS
jgi:hypothetical protein